jgi:hypothetical protein
MGKCFNGKPLHKKSSFSHFVQQEKGVGGCNTNVTNVLKIESYRSKKKFMRAYCIDAPFYRALAFLFLLNDNK